MPSSSPWRSHSVPSGAVVANICTMFCGPSSAIGPEMPPSRRVCSTCWSSADEVLDRRRARLVARREVHRHRGDLAAALDLAHDAAVDRAARSPLRGFAQRDAHASRRPASRRPSRRPARRCGSGCASGRPPPGGRRRCARRHARVCAGRERLPRRRPPARRRRRSGARASRSFSRTAPARLVELHRDARRAAHAGHLRRDDVHDLAGETQRAS